MYLYRPYSGPADATLEDCLMDNVLLFSYFVFMILMPALPILAGGEEVEIGRASCRERV